MHIVGVQSDFPRRLGRSLSLRNVCRHLLPMNAVHDLVCAILNGGRADLFRLQLLLQHLLTAAGWGRNPWHANSLEWMAPSPPGHGNFDFQPIVYRGPYEFNSPEVDDDYYPQTQPPPKRDTPAEEPATPEAEPVPVGKK